MFDGRNFNAIFIGDTRAKAGIVHRIPKGAHMRVALADIGARKADARINPGRMKRHAHGTTGMQSGANQ